MFALCAWYDSSRMSGWVLLDYDSRGNPLHAFELVRADSRWDIHLRACVEIADQVALIADRLGVRLAGPDGGPPGWTHTISISSEIRVVQTALELLQSVLTVPPPPELEVVLALDFFKTPPGPEPGATWGWTEVGGWVSRAKYTKSPWTRRKYGGRVADHLGRVMVSHPLYHDADAVIAAPFTENPFGALLARSVAARVGKPFFECHRRTERVAPAKGGQALQTLEDCQIEDLAGVATAVVIDDVYRSGRTMRSTAAAAATAGAQRVLGLVPARTLRKT